MACYTTRMHQADLSNEALVASLKALVASERRFAAKVIAYLVEVETRRLHLELACSSMFEFCTKKLGLSEGEAFRRLAAARLVQRFPKVLDALASGRVLLSSVVLLRDHFTEERVDELLAAAAGKTKREVEELVARLAPKPDVASSIAKLRAARVIDASTPLMALTPLSEDRYKVQLTADTALRDKLEHARALMRHRNPGGDLAVVVDRALDLLIAKLENERLGKTARPRASPRTSRPSTTADRARITRATRREVAQRDGGQCTYVSDDGERCSARDFLELDHRHPRALGGTGEAANVRLLCRAHNRLAAERVFGRDHVARKIYLRRERCRGDFAEEREVVEKALRAMGFGVKEVSRALDAMDPMTWHRPAEALVRDALAKLT